jgi:hypothetical protein
MGHSIHPLLILYGAVSMNILSNGREENTKDFLGTSAKRESTSIVLQELNPIYLFIWKLGAFPGGKVVGAV